MNKTFYNSSARNINEELQYTLEDMPIPPDSITIERPGGKITVTGFNELPGGFRESTKKLLDYVTSVFTAVNSANQSVIAVKVYFNIRDYAELVGYDISTTSRLKEFRKQLNADLAALYALSVNFKLVRRSKKKAGDFRICQDKGLEEDGATGTYYFTFGNKYAEELIKNNLVSQMPPALFSVGHKSRLAYPLGRYLSVHYSMDSNQNAGRHNVISVQAIMDAFQDYGVFDSDTAGHKKNRTRAREALEKALEECEDSGLLTWEYCGKKLKNGERERIEPPQTYQELRDAYIQYEILNAPDTSERRAKNAAAKLAAANKPKWKSSTQSGTRKRTAKKDADQANDQTTE